MSFLYGMYTDQRKNSLSHIFFLRFFYLNLHFRSALPGDARAPLIFPELRALDFFRSSRLLKERSYARKDRFIEVDEIYGDNKTSVFEFQPNIQDISSPKFSSADKFWISSWGRISIFGLSWVLFPYAIKFLFSNRAEITALQEADLSFLPAVSLVYGQSSILFYFFHLKRQYIAIVFPFTIVF